MTSTIVLIAIREIRQITRTRSFLLTLLILPAALMVSLFASERGERQPTVLVAIEGPPAEAHALRAALAIDDAQRSMNALKVYLDRYYPGSRQTRRLTASGSWFDDAAVLEYEARGGAGSFLREVGTGAPSAAVPAYVDPKPGMTFVPAAPEAVSLTHSAHALRSGHQMAAARLPDYSLKLGREPTSAFSNVEIVSRVGRNASMLKRMQSALTLARSLRQMSRSPTEIADSGPIRVHVVQAALQDRSKGATSIVTLTAAYLLLVSLLVTGSWMLQGVIEERANKLLEAILACVSPAELMYGKLVGTVVIGLAVIAFWIISCSTIVLAVGPKWTPEGAATFNETLAPSLHLLASPFMLFAIFYFFIMGFLMMAAIFLAIGAVSASFREAQGFLSPLLLLIVLPFSLTARSIIAGVSNPLISGLTWVPIYTPFAVLARLGGDIGSTEVLGAGAVLGAFVVLEVVLLERIFRRSLLGTGGHPNFLNVLRRTTSPKLV